MDLCKQQEIKSNSDILRTSIWLNEVIQKEHLFFPHWDKRGIRIIGDLVKLAGSVLAREQLSDDYNFRVNILEYKNVKKVVQIFIERYSSPGEFQLSRPYIPFHIQIFVKQNAGSKIYYSNFIKRKSEVARRCETRWKIQDWAQYYPKKIGLKYTKLVLQQQIMQVYGFNTNQFTIYLLLRVICLI